jgi:nucleotidyltransferase substrate binding protein (TIGR01987 family)
MNLFFHKYGDASKALKTLSEILQEEYSTTIQDAAIQRFEYTTEALWKCLQVYLKESEGIISASPKSCMREAKRIGLLNDKETECALEMIDARNMTSHTYHKEVSELLFKRLPIFEELMVKILEKIKPEQ